MTLIPAEYWDYSLSDAIRGLAMAFRAQRRSSDQYSIRIPGVGPALAVRSGRAGIMLALQALRLSPRAFVGVPLYCCPVVLKAIEAAGCRARFIDIDAKTYCMAAEDLAAKSSSLAAVIAVHMFGNLCDMPGLRAAAPGKPFIEDCAQALGSTLGGRPAGTFGEIAVFSFRSGKYVSAGEGGAVFCGDAALSSTVSGLIAALPAQSAASEAVHVLKTWMRSQLRTRPLWGLIGARLWEAYARNVSLESQSPVALGRIFKTDRAIAADRLPVTTSRIARQRRNASYYWSKLDLDAGIVCREKPGGFYNRLQFPLLLPSPEQCNQLAARLHANGIDTTQPYRDIAVIAAARYSYSGDCPCAESVARRVLVIPCNYGLRAADLEWIAACVNRAWIETNGARGKALLGRQQEVIAGPRDLS